MSRRRAGKTCIVYRSSVNGRFVKKSKADKKPREHEKERVRVGQNR